MKNPLHVGIIGEYDPSSRSHTATNDALHHAASALSVPLKQSWVSSRPLNRKTVTTLLSSFDAVWSAPGDYHNESGVLAAIRFAREQKRPFLGT